ncbi:hypothetical protein DFH08DRAFT_136512 [Mycena albidolilacea]|uniref:Uncharacterized protein n=1 Tax=Mycena albidolilacea TaxID=1033008 RepID=A0AAD7A440_9AGAR|nr:hypothetical protein DFH08DRAFT_136512 [Mycena albidolilacea]
MLLNIACTFNRSRAVFLDSLLLLYPCYPVLSCCNTNLIIYLNHGSENELQGFSLYVSMRCDMLKANVRVCVFFLV